jgi:hypothetical protein
MQYNRSRSGIAHQGEELAAMNAVSINSTKLLSIISHFMPSSHFFSEIFSRQPKFRHDVSPLGQSSHEQRTGLRRSRSEKFLFRSPESTLSPGIAVEETLVPGCYPNFHPQLSQSQRPCVQDPLLRPWLQPLRTRGRRPRYHGRRSGLGGTSGPPCRSELGHPRGW